MLSLAKVTLHFSKPPLEKMVDERNTAKLTSANLQRLGMALNPCDRAVQAEELGCDFQVAPVTRADDSLRVILSSISMFTADDLIDWLKQQSTDSALSGLHVINTDLFESINLHASVVETYGLVMCNLLTWLKSEEGQVTVPGGFDQLRCEVVGQCQDIIAEFVGDAGSLGQEQKPHVMRTIRLLSFVIRGGHCSSSVTQIVVSDLLVNRDDLVIRTILLFLTKSLHIEHSQFEAILAHLERVACSLTPWAQERVLHFICSRRVGRKVSAVQTDSILDGLSFTECHDEPVDWFNEFNW